MTLRDPIWLQTLEYSASDDRLPLFGNMVELPGVAGDTQMNVAAKTGMTVTVSSGHAIVPGNAVSGQGWYAVSNVGGADVTLDPGGTKPRYDQIILRVRDAQVSGSVSTAEFAVVKGRESSSPVYPSVPDMAIAVAGVRVNAGANSVASSHINNSRKWRSMYNRDMGGSIIPVKNRSEANFLAGRTSVSTTAPLFVYRADAHFSSRIEYTTNGNDWYPISPERSRGTIGIISPNYGTRRSGMNRWSQEGRSVTIAISIKRTGPTTTLSRRQIITPTQALPSDILYNTGGSALAMLPCSEGPVEVGFNSDKRLWIRDPTGSMKMTKNDWWVEGIISYNLY